MPIVSRTKSGRKPDPLPTDDSYVMRRHSHTRIVASSATKTQQTVDASEVDSVRSEDESEQQKSEQAQVKGTSK